MTTLRPFKGDEGGGAEEGSKKGGELFGNDRGDDKLNSSKQLRFSQFKKPSDPPSSLGKHQLNFVEEVPFWDDHAPLEDSKIKTCRRTVEILQNQKLLKRTCQQCIFSFFHDRGN